jgi:hypothetical protein
MSLVKSCVYCGTHVTITNKEEKSLLARGINLINLRVSCNFCSDKKIQPMQSEDG